MVAQNERVRLGARNKKREGVETLSRELEKRLSFLKDAAARQAESGGSEPKKSHRGRFRRNRRAGQNSERIRIRARLKSGMVGVVNRLEKALDCPQACLFDRIPRQRRQPKTMLA